MKKKAVVIDDDNDMTIYLSSILEDHDFSVRTATSADEAERIILDDPPHLICLDLVMPGRTGIQLFTRLRGNEKTKHIPCIMVTGINEQLNIDWKEIVKRLKARVPDGFIEKPAEPEQFMQLVNKVMNKNRSDGVQMA
ncbi:MAG: response regulator [Deltaproteobacteria bacterium]|nr:response regulator [Deltaproteobacteria bacterium]MBW2306611.1 response regulator [Deltaproteobacteria bacterium]